ncbi:MAG: hypothetical protein IT509_13565 [Rhodocyclaceae bacterium]|nr:hypothetical protein [Rhodocyclaceae bacterium]
MPTTYTANDPATLVPLSPYATAMELMVRSWFAAGHEVLWIPIIEVGDGPAGAAQARADAAQHGDPKLLRAFADLDGLPPDINGWLFPAHLNDTCIVAMRDDAGAVTFGSLTHPTTRQTLFYSSDTESGLLDLRRIGLPKDAPPSSRPSAV